MKKCQLAVWAALILVGCSGELVVGGRSSGGGSLGSDVAGFDSADSDTAGTGNVGTGKAGTGGAGSAAAEAGAAGEVTLIAGWADSGEAGLGSSGAGSGDCVGCTDNGNIAFGGTGGWSSPQGIAGSAAGPGSIGEPCITGGLLTEGDQSPAKAQIQTLPRCSEGLSCNADNTCVAAPDCPHDGDLCVVRHATVFPSGTGGAWGVGNANTAGNSTVDNGPPNGVTGMAASESRVYWVEYGTRDAKANYQHDGALLAYAPDDGTTSVIAAGLEGPVDVQITTSHAYVYVDGGRPLGTPIHPQLLRVSLSGGSAELVQDSAIPGSFAAADGRAFWCAEILKLNPKIYSMTSDPGAVPTEFVSGDSYGLTSDGTDLYYATTSGGLMRTLIASPAPVALGISADLFVLHDDGIFALQFLSPGRVMLARAPKAGGEFQRVRALGSGQPLGLRRIGDRYFFDATFVRLPVLYPNTEQQIRMASFVNDDPPVQLLQRSLRDSTSDLWAATANALYWSEGQSIYKRTLPAP